MNNIKYKPEVVKLLTTVKLKDENFYRKLRIIAEYDKIGVEMYLVSDKESYQSAKLFLNQFTLQNNIMIAEFTEEEMKFMLDGTYHTRWFTYFENVKFAYDNILTNNDTLVKILGKRWIIDDINIGSFDSPISAGIDGKGIYIKKIKLDNFELTRIPSEYGWYYEKRSKTLRCSIPNVIRIGEPQLRDQFIAQQIEIIEDYFMELRLLYNKICSDD